MTTIREGTISQIRQLLDEGPLLLDEHGPQMLEHAAESDRIDVLAFLIEAGVDVNAATLNDTPLVSAARYGTIETVQWLLDHGAEINLSVEPMGDTPLEVAIVEGRLEMVEFLMERGADPDILHGNPRRNALASAKFWGHDEIANLLESRGIAEIIIEAKPVDVESPDFMSSQDTLNPSEWFDAKRRHVYRYGLRHGLDAMCEKNRVLFLVGYLIDQLANGGAEQVYFNPSADYTPEMPDALDKIGASRAARVIRNINALFPEGAPSKDHETRMEQLESLPSEALNLGQALEACFDEWLPTGGERLMVGQLYDFYHS